MSATRLFHYAATVSLLGVFAFWCFIAWPAFRRTNGSETLEKQLNGPLLRLAWTSLLIAIVSGAAWLAFVAGNMSGMPLPAAIQGGVVGIVLTQTHFGQAWMVRAGLAVTLAVCLVLQARTRKRAPGWIGLLAAAVFIASLAWAGHGAARDEVPFDALHLPADILHLLAAGAWLGALLPLVILLVRACRDARREAVAAASAATLRFSVLGIWCVGTLLVTGVVNTWFLSGSVPALLGTLYGQLLLLKIALFATMIAVASVNQRRLLPRLAVVATQATRGLQTLREISRNASVEASLGILVLAVVSIIGLLPPGLHTEPRWPLPFRFDLSEIPAGSQTALDVAAIALALSLVATIVVAQRKLYRALAASIIVVVVFGIVGGLAMRPGIVRAYPTSFYASTQPYAAPSVTRGAPLYAQNCAVCHGATGSGDGPLAGRLPVRPANLLEPHLFAHKPGEMFWWISYGSDNHVMPGFADKLTPDQRWNLINFVLARAAGVLTRQASSHISTTTAFPLPNFAFERNGSQGTLSELLEKGPALVVLFATPAPTARLMRLAKLQPRLAAAGLNAVAVALQPSVNIVPPIVEVSRDVRAALALFRSPQDGGETELLLDRGGNVRARWTAGGTGGLADAGTLLRDSARVARIPVAAPNHAGHGH